MNSKTITIESTLAPGELVSKLSSMTITDFARLHSSPLAIYYGEITSHAFNIKNVRYSPMSPAPYVKGEIEEGVNNTILKVKIDINEHYKITRNMYYSTLLPIGIIVMLLSALVLGGTQYQLQGFLFSSAFIVCAVLAVVLTKYSLISMRKREVKELAARINGHILV
ncbi:hypothetical protein BH09BAC5_BH09BAC5_06850 [soil metagenome]